MPERVQPDIKRWRCSVCKGKYATKREAERCEKLPLENCSFEIGDKFVENASRVDSGRHRHGDSYQSPMYEITDIGLRRYIDKQHKAHHVAVYSWKASRPGTVRDLVGGERKMLGWLRPWKPGLRVIAAKEAGWVKLTRGAKPPMWSYARAIPIKGTKRWKVILSPSPRTRRKEILELTTSQIKRKFGPEIISAAKKVAA